MTVAAKCNITGLVLQELNKLHYGYNCKDNGLAIIENYLEFLSCPNIKLIVCNTEPYCNTTPNSFDCNFNITAISATLNPVGVEADIIFDLKVIDYAGGKLPLTYNWIYDEEDFDLVGSIEDSQVKLVLKEGKQLNLLITQIGVEVIDADGCGDSKYCWFVGGSMQCAYNYVPCSNATELTVIYEYVDCPRATNLTVTKA